MINLMHYMNIYNSPNLYIFIWLYDVYNFVSSSILIEWKSNGLSTISLVELYCEFDGGAGRHLGPTLDFFWRIAPRYHDIKNMSSKTEMTMSWREEDNNMVQGSVGLH